MLATAQVDHFRTFGFTVLSGYLADRVDALRAEVDAAIRDAYAATYDERVIDGISGHYLPMASRLTPVSAPLVCDDPRLIDDGIGVRATKFAVYLDDLTGDTGALRLMPGSQYPEQNAQLAAYSGRRGPARTEAEAAVYQASFPGYVAATSPGDVIVFDRHTWHASTGGRDRLAWTAVYQRCPETDAERDRTLRSVHDQDGW
jgi:hypothetical protein